MDTKYKIHDICEAIPPANKDDYAQLKSSIDQFGYDKNEPIVLHEDKILDGRTRYQICNELGIEPTFKKLNGEDPYEFVLKRNSRRNLTTGQKAVAADAMANMTQGRKERNANSRNTLTSLDEAAGFWKVGERTISDVRWVKEHDPKAYDRIRDGLTSVNAEKMKIQEADRRKAEEERRKEEAKKRKHEPKPEPEPAKKISDEDIRKEYEKTFGKKQSIEGNSVMTKVEAAAILGIPGCTNPREQSLRILYKGLSNIYHPDKTTGDHDMMAKINRAYEVLK